MTVIPHGHPCKGCGACCKYITIIIPKPVTLDDYDEIVWWLHHENIRVYIDSDKEWCVEFATKCKQLGQDLHCQDYENRPIMCEEYDPAVCSKADPHDDEERGFGTPEEFKAYLKEIGIDYHPRAEVARRKGE